MAGTFLGWGRAARVLLGAKNQPADDPFLTIWLGWVVVLFVLEVVHSFVAIRAAVVVPVAVMGLIFAAIGWVRWEGWRSWRWMLLALLAIVGFWIASRAMMPPRNYDSGLYHFNKIRWVNEHAIVPGLGNLHDRFGFNQSFFTYVAALNVPPLFGHGHVLANSFLWLLVFVQCVWQIMRRSPMRTWPHVFAMPVLLLWALDSDGLMSPSPDLASMLLQLAMFVMLVDGINQWRDEKSDQTYRAIVVMAVATAAVTIKLSNFAFAAGVAGVCLAYLVFSSRDVKDAVMRAGPAAGLCGLMMVNWCVRGVMLTGVPVYPSTLGYVAADWSMPIAAIENEAGWVRGWARKPFVHWTASLSDSSWLGPWIDHQLRNRAGFVFPLAWLMLTIVVVIAVQMLAWRRGRKVYRAVDFVPIALLLAGLAYWFAAAPDIRYVHAQLWLLPVAGALLVLRGVKDDFTALGGWLVLSMLMFANVHIVGYFAGKGVHELNQISLSGFQQTPAVEMKQLPTRSGLILLCPRAGENCWDSPLPSTPYYNAELRLRGAGLAEGFTVRPPKLSDAK